MAHALAAGALARPPGTRVAYPAELVQRYSVGAIAERLAAAYDRVLATIVVALDGRRAPSAA